MLVFRDGRETVSGPRRLQELAEILQRLSAASPSNPELLLDALLRAGELECALADSGWEKSQARMAGVTDALAGALIQEPASLQGDALELDVPATFEAPLPEGFAFYALHPLNYSDLAAKLACGPTAVIGIRSIGTTLSAMVMAELRRRGIPATRRTVRPSGHQFDRRVELDASTATWVAAERASGSDFWVVDEGPGLSGSSFLSVGEALEGAGVARERIRFLCSVEPRPHAMCARDAAARWARFQVHPVASPWRRPAEAAVDISAGRWREGALRSPAEWWPASWTQFERQKYLSADRRRLYKFEGFGRFGAEIAERASCIAEAGFGVPARRESDGFYSVPMIVGQPAISVVLDRALLERLAAYCAFRASAFPDPASGQPVLQRMMAWNYFEEFGKELDASRRVLPLERPVIVDGRMQPHEWIAGTWLLKTDAAGHGNDHFFPGPTDIAWDLAGAIVEWRLPPAAAEHFLERYGALSGDDARPRIEPYRLAYTLFRMGYCKMAAEAMRGTEEEKRLSGAYLAYRSLAQYLTRQAAAA